MLVFYASVYNDGKLTKQYAVEGTYRDMLVDVLCGLIMNLKENFDLRGESRYKAYVTRNSQQDVVFSAPEQR